MWNYIADRVKKEAEYIISTKSTVREIGRASCRERVCTDV